MKGDYVLRAQIYSYDNPTNFCEQCGSDRGCCDGFQPIVCQGDARCDNEFFFCTRPLGTALPEFPGNSVPEIAVESRARSLQCLQPSGALRSRIDINAAQMDFSSNGFLGLSNPMEFEMVAPKWEVNYVAN